MEKTDFQKAWKTFEIIALGFVLLSILIILYSVRELLTPFIIAFVIVFFLNPIVNYMEGGGISRTLAVVILFVLSIFVLFILWKLTWPMLQSEIYDLKENAPLYLNRIQAGLDRAIDLLEKNIGFLPKGTLGKPLHEKINSLTSGTGDVSSLIKIVKELATSFHYHPLRCFFSFERWQEDKKSAHRLCAQ